MGLSVSLRAPIEIEGTFWKTENWITLNILFKIQFNKTFFLSLFYTHNKLQWFQKYTVAMCI